MERGERPWGTYTVLEENKSYKIKRIEVNPGQRLSLQMHHHRSEHWIVVSGTARVICGTEDLHTDRVQSPSGEPRCNTAYNY
jgi:mannose-6-phosphate isomerase